VQGKNRKAQFLQSLQYTQDAATLCTYELQIDAEPSPATNEKHGITENQMRLASDDVSQPRGRESGLEGLAPQAHRAHHMMHRQRTHPKSSRASSACDPQIPRR
jgi:hypothetical protein